MKCIVVFVTDMEDSTSGPDLDEIHSKDGDGVTFYVFPFEEWMTEEDVTHLVRCNLSEMIGSGDAINFGGSDWQFSDDQIYDAIMEIARKEEKQFWWVQDNEFSVGVIEAQCRKLPSPIHLVYDAARLLGWQGQIVTQLGCSDGEV